MRPLRLRAPTGPGGVPAGSAAQRPPLSSAGSQPGAHSPSPPPVPPFSPQVLKLSLRGDTAAAAALLPLLCLPMDMHCKADPFSAMHREYRRPAPVPARGSPSHPSLSCPVLYCPEASLASYAQVTSWRPPWLLLVPTFRSSSFSHFSVYLKTLLFLLPYVTHTSPTTCLPTSRVPILSSFLPPASS